MAGSLLRTVLIWGVLLVALFNIYPTIGWMTLDDAERAAKEKKWAEEDAEFARNRPTAMTEFFHGLKRWSEFDNSRVITLGLDLQGGIDMILGFDFDEIPEDKMAVYREANMSDSEITSTVQATMEQQIRRRINEFEAKEPVIQALGDDQVQIQLPGEKDIARAQALITKTAVLNFHIVAGPDEAAAVLGKIRDAYPNEFIEYLERSSLRGGGVTVSQDNYARVKDILDKARAKGGIIPEDKLVLFSQPPKAWGPQIYDLYVVDKDPIQTGEGLRSASAIPDNTNPPYWEILFEFNAAAGNNFGKVTQANMGNPMAIVLDNVVVSAPTINGRITTNGSITGSFEAEEARDLAIALNSGSMVVPVTQDYTGVVGATLGAESVRKGVTSSLVGIAIVAVFMLIYYMAAGIVAMASLAMNAILVIAAMAYFDMTLTLPGIAGLILTVGMAVDANVLIFERIREELKLGHSLISSVESGFSHATSTIMDANITTLIAAAVLMQFGTGPIEGFAIALSIGVCTSVFTALVVSRALMDFLVGRKLVTKMTMLSLIKDDIHFGFLSARRMAAVVSVAMIVVGMAMFGYRVNNGDMFGVDFTEGTNARLTLIAENQVPVEDIRIALANAGFDGPSVQRAGTGEEADKNHFVIRVGETNTGGETAGDGADAAGGSESKEESVRDRILAALAPLTDSGTTDDKGIDVGSVTTVGPAVGEQLRFDAVQAVLASLIFIVLYVTFRFEMKFAVGAVVALIHDVFITLGLLALLDRPITMPVVAAVLTIIGYSLNDTIVVFDRIREDMADNKGKGIKIQDLLDSAINRTLARTTLTSMTTLFVVIVLFLFGGDAINDFALALMIGIIVGTYSSIFVASPVVYLWHEYVTRVKVDEDGKPKGGAKKKKKKKASAAGGSIEEATT